MRKIDGERIVAKGVEVVVAVVIVTAFLLLASVGGTE